MRILLCDDDVLVLQQMKKYLMEFFYTAKLRVPEIISYSSGDALVDSGDSGEIAFLDVEMPGISGIYAGEKLKQRNPKIKIIILTSFMDYLDEAMQFQVFRYLSKPIDKKRLFRNLKEAIHQIEMETMPVAIETKQGVVVREADNIIMVEAKQRKVVVAAVDDLFETIKPMREWESLLTIGCFFRTHRSFIINMRYVSSFTKETVRLIAPNHKEYIAYLTKRQYSNFKAAYLLYLESTR